MAHPISRSAFAHLCQRSLADTRKTDGLFVGADPSCRRGKTASSLSQRQNLPAIYDIRLAAEAGGLISYGANSLDTQRWAGVYAGEIPANLIARADEVIQ